MAEVETNHQHKQGKFIKINRGLKQNRKSRSMTFKRLHVLVLYKTLSLLFLIPSKPYRGNLSCHFPSLYNFCIVNKIMGLVGGLFQYMYLYVILGCCYLC
jgi:hypothetical protein